MKNKLISRLVKEGINFTVTKDSDIIISGFLNKKFKSLKYYLSEEFAKRIAKNKQWLNDLKKSNWVLKLKSLLMNLISKDTKKDTISIMNFVNEFSKKDLDRIHDLVLKLG